LKEYRTGYMREYRKRLREKAKVEAERKKTKIEVLKAENQQLQKLLETMNLCRA